MEKKRLILLSVAVLIIIFLMLLIFVFPYQLPRDLCISDSQCTYRLGPNSCNEYQCNNIFWRPAESFSEECALKTEPPKCGCVDFHCEKTDTEYSRYYCTVDGKKYTEEEYYNIFIYGELQDKIGFEPVIEQINLCRCYPKEGKDKFVIIMKKDSQFYSEELNSKLNKYFEAVKSDVGVENIGVLFFEGDSYAFREKLHSLYLEQDVGYALLIGNDLLEDFDYEENLGFPTCGLPFGESDCPAIAISVLPAPPYLDVNEQKEFISGQIDNYVLFHKNPENYLSDFSRSYIRIVNLDAHENYTSFDPSSPDIHEDIKYHWDLPKRDILSSDPNLKSEIRMEKPMILQIVGHGWSRVLAWQVTPNASYCLTGIPSQNPPCMGNTDQWLNFTKDFTPSVFIIVGGCGSMIIDDYNSGEHGGHLAEFCCWPQAFLKSGAITYLSDAHGRAYDFTSSDFFGQALKKIPLTPEYFGDLFAHL